MSSFTKWLIAVGLVVAATCFLAAVGLVVTATYIAVKALVVAWTL